MYKNEQADFLWRAIVFPVFALGSANIHPLKDTRYVTSRRCGRSIWL